MIKNTYSTQYSAKFKAYTFQSIGPKGIINKIVIFEEIKNNTYNVALCDFIDGKFVDDKATNNQDTIKVLSTVMQTIYDFLNLHPEAKIEVESRDKKRLRVYNRIAQRRYSELVLLLDLRGIVNKKEEIYNPRKVYDIIILQKK